MNMKALGIAVAALAVCSVSVKAQNSTTMGTTSTSSAMTPVTVTGSVLRYYVDRSGYVTAVDVQTSDGIRMVRFSPGMAQRVTQMYPVGSTATLYATQGTYGWNLVGLGPSMPAPNVLMQPYLVSDLDLLESQPYTTVGAAITTVSGTLTGYVANKMGDVVGIVLDNNKLVRVGPEFRQGPADNVPDNITPLMKGAVVEATGLPEAPRYGVLSPFESRLIATAITVNGRALGSRGFGRLDTRDNGTLFNWNINGLMGKSPEEVQAGQMGYSTYTVTPVGTM